MDILGTKLQEAFNQSGYAFNNAQLALQPVSSMTDFDHGTSPANTGIHRETMLRAHTGIVSSRRPEYDTDHIGVWNLLGYSTGNDMLTDTYAWVIASCCNPFSSPFVPALGMNHAAFARLLARHFPHFIPPRRWLALQNNPVGKEGLADIFSGLVQLLLDHRADTDEHHRCIAHLVAAACMGDGPLWHDLGLPDCEALSDLLFCHFPALAENNTGDMIWKEFFHQQLLERKGAYSSKEAGHEACLYYPSSFEGPPSLLSVPYTTVTWPILPSLLSPDKD